MRNMLKTMRTRLERGEELVLVTVVAASGAVPRGAGARMLVGKEGRICGTIGGGAVEYRSQQLAARVLEEKASGQQDFSLTRDDVQSLGMICGGAVNVFFHYIPGGDEKTLALLAEAEQRFEGGEDFWLISDIGRGGELSLADKQGPLAPYLLRRPYRLQEGGRDLCIEQLSARGRVYIFGGGHVAQELEPVLSHLGFRCVVLDDRPEFTRRELFPTAEEVRTIDFQNIGRELSIGQEDYVCVMTRGHASDTAVQAQVLKRHPAYVGVIGSRHKAAGVRKVLKEEYGLTDAELDLVTTPIGISIQAETPAEIAISIAAQMIEVRARLAEQPV